MSLKTSFFNPALLKANIKRFWWISAGYFILFLTIGILPLVDHSGFGTPYTENYVILNVISMCASALMPAIMFSYLNSSGAVTCMHAFPMKRRAHYITNLFTIYALFLLPALIGYAFSWGYAAVNYPTILGELFEYFIISIVLNTISISGAMLGVMVTGNTIAAIAFGGLFIFFPYYTEAIIKSFLDINVFGIWTNEFFFLENFNVEELTPFMVGYFIVSIAILVLCWFLYKNRKLETNGDIISFNFLKPVFIACVSVILGFLGYYYFSGIYNLNNIFFMLPFGILGVVISYMLSKKAFTIKGIHKPVILYVLAVAALFVTIKFDLTGYERRIPDLEDIKSVNLYYGQIFNNYNQLYHIDGEEYEYVQPITNEMFEITDTEDIQNVIKLHSHIIETRNDKYREHGKIFPVVYTLNNGKKIKRMYHMSYEMDKEFLVPVWETEQKRREEWEILLPVDMDIISVSVSDVRLGNSNPSFAIYDGNDEKAKQLIDALKTDLKNATFEDIYCNRTGTTRIQMSIIRPMKNVETGELLTSREIQTTYHQDNFQTALSPEFKNTWALLNSWGLEDKVVKPWDISAITLNINDKEKYSTVTDPQTIAELYEYTKSMCYTNMFSTNMFPDGIYDIRLDFCDKNSNLIYQMSVSRETIKPVPSVLIAAAQKYKDEFLADDYPHGEKAVSTAIIGGADAPTEIIID